MSGSLPFYRLYPVYDWYTHRSHSLVYWGQQTNEKIFVNALGAMLVGTIIIVGVGVLHLSQLYGMEKALEYGFYPFWKGAIIKIILGALLAWTIKKNTG